MKRILSSILLLAGVAMYAQPGIIDIHPAGNPSGKIMTMEEAIWTLSGFFGDGGSASRSAAPNTAPQHART